MAKEKAPQVRADEGAQATDDCSTVSYEQKVFDEMRELSIKFASGNPDGLDWSELAYTSYEDYDRGRAWWMIGYPESVDPNWYEKVTSAGLQGAVSPLHNRDCWPNGMAKKDHGHWLFYFPGKKSFAQVKELAESLRMVRPQEVNNLVGACRYLAHLDIQPDKQPSDRFKVRYNPDEIVTFGGFDVQAYIKTTATQKTQVMRELRSIVRECDFTSYHKFVDYIAEKKPEYEFYVAQGDISSEMYRYIFSRYRGKHPQSEETQAIVAAIMAAATGEQGVTDFVDSYLAKAVEGVYRG